MVKKIAVYGSYETEIPAKQRYWKTIRRRYLKKWALGRPHLTDIRLDLPEGSAIKFVAHNKYDEMLCKHVYYGFCQQCSQWKCGKRRL